jgi:hypothetical protein
MIAAESDPEMIALAMLEELNAPRAALPVARNGAACRLAFR